MELTSCTEVATGGLTLAPPRRRANVELNIDQAFACFHGCDRGSAVQGDGDLPRDLIDQGGNLPALAQARDRAQSDV